MRRTIGEMSAGDWARASENYGLRTEVMGATCQTYGGLCDEPEPCGCGCSGWDEEWTDLLLRFESGEIGI